jgi:hypothetical protein
MSSDLYTSLFVRKRNLQSPLVDKTERKGIKQLAAAVLGILLAATKIIAVVLGLVLFAAWLTALLFAILYFSFTMEF